MNLRKLSKTIHPEKMSAQMILATYATPSKEVSQKIHRAMVKTVSEHIDNLNKNQQDETWFKILSDDPVIVKNKPDWFLIFCASILFGIFSAFWLVMIRHYLR
jgi:capsular polysaccharide biosynthesis protein